MSDTQRSSNPGAAALLREVMLEHRDEQSDGFNDCRNHPCQWCEWAAQTIKELEQSK